MLANGYRAVLRDVRITPRKARLVADLVRGRKVEVALDTLRVTKKKGARILTKVIQSAMANAADRATVDVDRLIIGEALIDGAGMWKRWLPRAQGRATPIKKRLSHISITLVEK